MTLDITFRPDSDPSPNIEPAVRAWFTEYCTGSFCFPKAPFNTAKSFSSTVHLKEGDVLMAIHDLHEKLYLLGVSFEVNVNTMEINCEISNLPPL